MYKVLVTPQYGPYDPEWYDIETFPDVGTGGFYADSDDLGCGKTRATEHDAVVELMHNCMMVILDMVKC